MISESCSKGKFMYINSLSLDPQAPEFLSGAFKIQNKKKFYPYHKKQVPVLDRAVETIPRETYTMYTGPTLWPQGFCVRQFNLSVRSRQGLFNKFGHAVPVTCKCVLPLSFGHFCMGLCIFINKP